MDDRDFTSGIPVDELTANAMIAGKVGGDDVLLVRDGENVRAIGAFCTHYHGPLAEGVVVDGAIRCPWHHACFNLTTGAVLRAPAPAPLPVWRVERRGDRYFIGEQIVIPAVARQNEPESVVIIGAGAAGIFVAGALRSEGYDGRIVMISREADLPYDKPNLSKDYLAGTASPDWLPVHPRDYYDQQRIDLRLGVIVASIDPVAKYVATSGGERIPFGALVLATGCVPRTLAVPGAERVQLLRTRKDAETLVANAASSQRVVVIGSSFIGLEVAASLRQKGLSVVVTSPDLIPLQRVLGEEVGSHIRSIHEKRGVEFRLGRSIARIDGSAVVLDNGERLDAGLMIGGVGVLPDTTLARDAGIETGDGVIVNEFLETSAAGVYACGDIAAWAGHDGEHVRVEHWVVAGRQGQTVARNILGLRQRFDAVPFFWSAHFDTTISYVGHGKWDTVDVRGSLEKNDATIVYRRAGEITAVATIGRDRVSLAAEEAMERRDKARLEEVVK